jgi:acyl-coenzyme A thioesterase PaaI-like protein
VVSYALASSAVPSLPSLSISLNIEFFASAPRGAWLEGVATLQRVGNSIGFVSCDLKIGDDTIAHASSALKILRRR